MSGCQISHMVTIPLATCEGRRAAAAGGRAMRWLVRLPPYPVCTRRCDPHVLATLQSAQRIRVRGDAAASWAVMPLTLVGRPRTRVADFCGFKRRHHQRRVQPFRDATATVDSHGIRQHPHHSLGVSTLEVQWKIATWKIATNPPARVIEQVRGVARDRSSKPWVTGLFTDRDRAERGYQALTARGYDAKDINLVMSDDTRKKHFASGAETELGTKAAKGAGVGGAIGGTVGAIAAAIAAVGTSIAIPGLGLVVAGPLAAALAGAGAGGAAGGLVGALIGAGIPEERVKHYEQGSRPVAS